MLKRNDPELEGLFNGEEGLWAAVLLDILNEIEQPADKGACEQARRIIMEPESGCLPFIADALGITPDELQRRIIRHLQKKRITIS
jgi:hypothetical protein